MQCVLLTNSLWSASAVKQSWAECCKRPHSVETQVDEYSGERLSNGCCLELVHRSPQTLGLFQLPQPACYQYVPLTARDQITLHNLWSFMGFLLTQSSSFSRFLCLKLYHLIASATKETLNPSFSTVRNLLKTHSGSFFRLLMKILNNIESGSTPEGPLRDSATKQILSRYSPFSLVVYPVFNPPNSPPFSQ